MDEQYMLTLEKEEKQATPTFQEIRWQCRRGMLELDLFLISFSEKMYETLTHLEKQRFADFLKESDQDMFDWLMDKIQCPILKFQPLIQKIRKQKGLHNPEYI